MNMLIILPTFSLLKTNAHCGFVVDALQEHLEGLLSILEKTTVLDVSF